MNNYEDIINLKHYKSSKRIPMSQENRAAQFAPFQALTGYSSAIKETSRQTQKKIELTEEEKEKINETLNNLINNPYKKVILKHFIKDTTKSGGEYLIYKGIIKKIDIYNQIISLENNKKVLFNNIYSLEII